jgi:hypothetical protein
MVARCSLLLLLGVSGFAAAQGAPVPADPQTPSVVWRLSPDGDWLAAQPAGDEHAAPLIVAPAEPRIDGGPGDSYWTSGFGWSVGRQLTVSVSSTEQVLPTAARAGAAPWCDGLSGLLAVSGYANDCLRSALGPDLQPRIQRERAGVAWSGSELGVFVSYGVTRADDGGWFAALAGVDSPGWSGSGATGWSLPPNLALAGIAESQDLTVGGAWRLSPRYAFTVSAMVGEIALAPDAQAGIGLYDQAGLRLGIARGNLSGGITGRVARPSGIGIGPTGVWSGLDLGVSWRTPWDGELSFGAENLISRGSESLLPDPTLANPPVADPSTARSPYVRYKQDL